MSWQTPKLCATAFINVVLPEPNWPTRPTTSPELKSRLNFLAILKVPLTFFEKNTLASQRTLSEANILFNNSLFKTVIPKNTTIALAAFEKKPVALYDIDAPGSIAYLNLAREIIHPKRR